MTHSTSMRSVTLLALLLALVMTAVTVFEPLSVDDCCHLRYAAQVAEQPLAPYEFELLWHQRTCAAWTVMVAPGNSYYLAPAVALAESVPVAWRPVIYHLWYLPLYWVFCFALLSLARRWLRRGAGTVAAIIALGPVVLPGLNLLLELPMLALAFGGLATFARAVERRSARTAIGAGLLWGCAFQVKYSAMAFFAPWLLVAYLAWRWREWVIGLVATVTTALAIEGLLSLSHGGGSYFLQQLSYTQQREWDELVKGMFLQVGVLAIPGVLLALHGLRAPRWLTPAVVLLYVVGLSLVAAFPDTQGSNLLDGAVDSIAYLVMAATTWAVIAASAWCALRGGWVAWSAWRGRRSRALRLLVVGWLCAEIVSSFVLSPFPAARRVLMVVVAFTVLGAWLAVRQPGHVGSLRRALAAALVLGLGIQSMDYVEGNSWRAAATGTAQYLQEHVGEADAYFTGGWGFAYYAPLAGLQPFVCDGTALEAGDYVVCGSIDGVEGAWFWPEPPEALDPRFEWVETLAFGCDAIPFSTNFGYYSGQRPIDSQVGARFLVRVLRAKQAIAPGELAAWDDPHFNRPDSSKQH